MRLLSVLMWSALCLMLIMTATMRNAAAEETAANGVFLVATRDIRDPNFKESVIKRATQRRTHKTDPMHAAAYP